MHRPTAHAATHAATHATAHAIAHVGVGLAGGHAPLLLAAQHTRLGTRGCLAAWRLGAFGALVSPLSPDQLAGWLALLGHNHNSPNIYLVLFVCVVFFVPPPPPQHKRRYGILPSVFTL